MSSQDSETNHPFSIPFVKYKLFQAVSMLYTDVPHNFKSNFIKPFWYSYNMKCYEYDVVSFFLLYNTLFPKAEQGTFHQKPGVLFEHISMFSYGPLARFGALSREKRRFLSAEECFARPLLIFLGVSEQPYSHGYSYNFGFSHNY